MDIRIMVFIRCILLVVYYIIFININADEAIFIKVITFTSVMLYSVYKYKLNNNNSNKNNNDNDNNNK